MNKPLLSICICTYNHYSFIRQAIEGVLMQKLNFKIEIIIADDFSNDGTRCILNEYKEKYPDLITLLFQEANVGAVTNWIQLIKKPVSKYIAYLEGDDYWTDPLKLQKQVEFLETNEDYAICYHRVNLLTGEKIEEERINTSLVPLTYTILDLSHYNLIQTCSAVYRNNKNISFEILKKCTVGDYPLHLLNARFGKIYYFPDLMAVYRIHASSNWSSKSNTYKSIKFAETLEILIIEFFDNSAVSNHLKKQIVNLYITLYNYFRYEIEDHIIAYKYYVRSIYHSEENALDYYKNFILIENKLLLLEKELILIKNSRVWKIRNYLMSICTRIQKLYVK